MNVLLWIVTITGVIGSAVMLGVGLHQEKVFSSPVRATAKKVMEAGEKAVDENAKLQSQVADSKSDDGAVNTLEAQSSAIGALGSALEGMAAFAGSLKDLDSATRHYLVSVVFLLVAVASASVGQIAG
jgi:hypothetical protein